MLPSVSMQPVKFIGKSTSGVVCSACVDGTVAKVAIKKVCNAFENSSLEDARQALRETMLLRQLHHENIISLKNILIPVAAKRGTFKDVYFVYEFMDTDLDQIIFSNQPLSDEHFQHFIYQVRC
jgi:serine/threonine protein kinase